MECCGHIPYAVGLDGVLTDGMDEIAHVEELENEFFDIDQNQQLPPEGWVPYIIQVVQKRINPSSSAALAEFERENQSTLKRIAGQLQEAEVPLDTNLIVSESLRMKMNDPEAFLTRPETKYEVIGYRENFLSGNERHLLLCKAAEIVCAIKYDFDRWILVGLHNASVMLLLATDSGAGNMGIVPGFSIQDELHILVENGFTPYEALQTGTVNAAHVVEKMTGEGNFGTIEIGKRADLVLVTGNPLEDITTIREPLGVMAAGRWYSSEQLTELLEIPRSK
jgi:hypothetical protein